MNLSTAGPSHGISGRLRPGNPAGRSRAGAHGTSGAETLRPKAAAGCSSQVLLLLPFA